MGSDEADEKGKGGGNWWGKNIGPRGVKSRASIAKVFYCIAATLWVAAYLGKVDVW